MNDLWGIERHACTAQGYGGTYNAREGSPSDRDGCETGKKIDA